MRYRLRRFALALTALLIGATSCVSRPPSAMLPPALSDEEFWHLSTGLSEPPGVFTHSDNLVSNEDLFPHSIRVLRPVGGVYIGVGPEQNFSYIARLQPDMAFILDIRAENRNLHLLYKALFEVSADRAEFVSRLFSRPRPAGLDQSTSVDDLFAASAAAPPSTTAFDEGIGLVRSRLLETHGLPLTPNDLGSIDYAFHAFYSDGPDIDYGRARPGSEAGPSYRALMTATDVWGQPRSYLATEEAFAIVKDLHARNLIVPVVGDFAGPDAMRRIGEYVREHGSTIAAFYGSNVEIYLSKQETAAFCGNLASLPAAAQAWFIGNKGLRRLSAKLKTCLAAVR